MVWLLLLRIWIAGENKCSIQCTLQNYIFLQNYRNWVQVTLSLCHNYSIKWNSPISGKISFITMCVNRIFNEKKYSTFINFSIRYCSSARFDLNWRKVFFQNLQKFKIYIQLIQLYSALQLWFGLLLTEFLTVKIGELTEINLFNRFLVKKEYRIHS
jgi:hypothetical protein